MENGVFAGTSTQTEPASSGCGSAICVGIGAHTSLAANSKNETSGQTTREVRSIAFVLGGQGYGLDRASKVAERDVLGVDKGRDADMTVNGSSGNVDLV